MSTLTPEQKKRIEENRRIALERRAAKQNGASSVAPVVKSVPLAKPPSLLETIAASTIDRSNLKRKLDFHTIKSWHVLTDTITGRCKMISAGRFSVEIAYNSQVVEIMKTIPGREYDAKSKSWNFPVDQYQTLKDKIAPLAPKVVIGDIPKNIQKMLKGTNGGADYKSIDISQIDETLRERLFPFQIEGVQFGVSKRGKCLIADEMGLGKTIQALGIADYFYEEWPLLIVCPSSMRFQWEEEILRNLPKVSSYSIAVGTSSKSDIMDHKVVILSYDLMPKFKQTLMSYGFGIVIFDECHSLKNMKTQRTLAALDISKQVRRIILLSGTPALSRPIELYSQIKLLHPNLFFKIHDYGVRYCDGKMDNYGWNFQGYSNLDELRLILEEKLMIRRLKSEVLEQLPSKIRQVIPLSLDLIKKNKDMHRLEKKLIEFDQQENNKKMGKERRHTLLAYYTETGKVKINAICKYIEELLEQNKKFLCFGHHKEVLDAICKVLEEKETYYIRIDGSVSSEERKSVCDQFQEEEKFRVAVLSITAANMGVTLTAAQLVIFVELFWNPGELIQAEDRAHRIGQKGSVLVQYLLAKGTADDYIWPMVQSKMKILNEVGLIAAKTLDPKPLNSQDKTQSTISDYFEKLDDDIDEQDLLSLMDDIEGSAEKKIKT